MTRAFSLGDRVATLPGRLLRPPWIILVPLMLVQSLLVLPATGTITHNGWLFPQGGTATYLYGAASTLAHGHIPPAEVGYGWPLLTTPIAWLSGRIFLDGLPALVLIQTLVLLPIALLAVYGIAQRIGGRLLGYFTAACWVFVPYAAIPLFVPTYRQAYEDQLLPQALGLTGLSGLPSMVCLLAAAYFALTSIDTDAPLPAALAGLLSGFAIGIDPANALFLVAPFAGFTIARRWQPALAFGVALLPALATFALWRYRGLGHVPGIHVHVDFAQLRQARLDFRSTFYSDHLVEVAFLAGVIGIARRSWSKSAFVAAWFAAFLVVQLSTPGASIPQATWFGLLLPGFPAFLIACCSLPLLVPRFGERLAGGSAAPPREARLNWRDPRLAPVATLLAVVPIVVVAALPLEKAGAGAVFPDNQALVAVDASFQPQATPGPGTVSLIWPARGSSRAATFYSVFRSRQSSAKGLDCDTTHGAARCVLSMKQVGSSTQLSYGDQAPSVPSGGWTYRIGLAANALADPNAGGGLLLLSAPVDVTVP